MSRRSAAVYRALFTAARAPPVAPAPVPAPVLAPARVPEPEVIASAGGEEEEPMDTGCNTLKIPFFKIVEIWFIVSILWASKYRKNNNFLEIKI